MKVIFTSSRLPLALMIRGMTGCKYHHCGIIDGNRVIEASIFHGVRAVSLETFKHRGEYVVVDIPLKDENAAREFLINQEGKGYDWTGALSYPFRKNWQNKDKWYCSELVAAVAKEGGTPIVREGVKTVTPRDIYIHPYNIVSL